jgi:hypothetical protein
LQAGFPRRSSLTADGRNSAINKNISPVQTVPVFENALPGKPADGRRFPKAHEHGEEYA